MYGSLAVSFIASSNSFRYGLCKSSNSYAQNIKRNRLWRRSLNSIYLVEGLHLTWALYNVPAAHNSTGFILLCVIVSWFMCALVDETLAGGFCSNINFKRTKGQVKHSSQPAEPGNHSTVDEATSYSYRTVRLVPHGKGHRASGSRILL